MKNFIQEGHSMNFANSSGSDINAGDAVVVGKHLGVATVKIANGDSGSIALCGVYTLPKATGGALTQGQAVYWDTVANNIVGSSGTNATNIVGMAFEAAASGDTSCSVRLI